MSKKTKEDNLNEKILELNKELTNLLKEVEKIGTSVNDINRSVKTLQSIFNSGKADLRQPIVNVHIDEINEKIGTIIEKKFITKEFCMPERDINPEVFAPFDTIADATLTFFGDKTNQIVNQFCIDKSKEINSNLSQFNTFLVSMKNNTKSSISAIKSRLDNAISDLEDGNEILINAVVESKNKENIALDLKGKIQDTLYNLSKFSNNLDKYLFYLDNIPDKVNLIKGVN